MLGQGAACLVTLPLLQVLAEEVQATRSKLQVGRTRAHWHFVIMCRHRHNPRHLYPPITTTNNNNNHHYHNRNHHHHHRHHRRTTASALLMVVRSYMSLPH